MSSEIVGVMNGLGVDGVVIGGVAGGGIGNGGGEFGADVSSGVLKVSSSELESCCSKVRGAGASSILDERSDCAGDGGKGVINGIGDAMIGVGAGKESGEDVVDMVVVRMVMWVEMEGSL